MEPLSIALVICSAILSGLGTAIVNSSRDARKEKIRQHEHAQDLLRIDVKDLKIELYELERDLNSWKDKYYKAMQELIEIKAELENAINQLNHIEYHAELDTE